MPDLAPIEIPQPLVASAQEAIDNAHALVIASDDDASVATDTAKLLGKLIKQVEAHRKEIVGPFNDQVKRINAMYARTTEPLEEADTIVRRKLLAFQSEKNRKAAEDERKRREDAALAVAARAEAEGNQGKADMALKIAVNTPTPDTRTTSTGQTGATAGIRKTWTFEIVDHEAVPREYLVVDPEKVKYAIRSGERQIPGIRIFEKEGLAIR